MTTAGARREMRSDARVNRAKLVDAAGDLFASDGVDVPLETVARQAGVGIGTLYRHFPSRHELVEAVYRHEVERLCSAATDLLQRHPPDVALEEWMRRFVTYTAAKRGMADALQAAVAASDSDLYSDTRERLLEAVAPLLTAAVASGSVRADMEPEDVLQAMSGIWLIPDGDQWNARAERQLNLLMDGLRFGAGRPPG
jgi:AcrR family transcriptional regulator